MRERFSRLDRRVRVAAIVFALVVATVLTVRVLLAGSSAEPEESRRPAPTADETDDGSGGDSGAASTEAGVAVGFERSESGAVAAGVSYASASQSWLYLSDVDLTPAIEAVVSPDARDDTSDGLTADVAVLRDELADASGTVWFLVAPLATRVESYSDDRAVVRVWVMRLLSADGVAVPQSGWETVTFDLDWASGDWRVADYSIEAGPVPQLEAGAQPWSASYLDETLTGFARVGGG